MKLVSRTHPGFMMNDEFNLWNLLVSSDALVKTTIQRAGSTNPYLTADTVLTKQANFPDFMNMKAREVWKAGLESLNAQLPFDGISIEEDGPYIACDGECPGTLPDPSPP